MNSLRRLFKSMPAENLIIVGNLAVISVIGTNMFIRNLEVMNKENHFEKVDKDHLAIEKLRNLKHPNMMYEEAKSFKN